jgi:superfamily I DNA/RNA helicase
MISRGIPSDHILAVTFTNKAAREMRGRVREMLPRKPRSQGDSNSNGETAKPTGPTLCTFHSLCVRILRQHIEKLGYKRNFVIYDQAEQISVVKKILARVLNKQKVDAGQVLGFLSRFKNGGAAAVGVQHEEERAMAEHVRARYDSALHACNAVDFDDLILLTLRLFREHPEALEACRSKFQYVMVDEYQDTNAANSISSTHSRTFTATSAS